MGKCGKGDSCDFAHSVAELNVPMNCLDVAPSELQCPERRLARASAPKPEEPSWASTCDSDDLSTCFSDGDGSSLSSSNDFIGQGAEECQLAVVDEDVSGRAVLFLSHLTGVTVKNTFLQFGMTSHGSGACVRRSRSAT